MTSKEEPPKVVFTQHSAKDDDGKYIKSIPPGGWDSRQMPKSESVWILERETCYANGEKIVDDIGHYTMKSLAATQVRYLNGTVANEDKSKIHYRTRDVEANRDFSH